MSTQLKMKWCEACMMILANAAFQFTIVYSSVSQSASENLALAGVTAQALSAGLLLPCSATCGITCSCMDQEHLCASSSDSARPVRAQMTVDIDISAMQRTVFGLAVKP